MDKLQLMGFSVFPTAKNFLTGKWSRTMLRAFVFAGYVVAPEPLWAMLFYLLILPVELYRTVTSSLAGVQRRAPDPVAIAGYCLIAWFILCVAWDQGALGHPSVRILWLFNGLCTMVFVSACIRNLQDPDDRDQMISWITIGTLIGVTIGLVRAPFVALDWADWQPRLHGWAEMRLPITGAMIAGLGVLFALERAVAGHQVWRNSATIALGALFIFLTGSRTPIVALVIAIVVFLGMHSPIALIKWAVAVALTGAVIFLAVPGTVNAVSRAMLERGDSHRLRIWSVSVNEILEMPWIGHGPAARLPLTGFGAFPHNLFLSTLFYAGIVGLALLLTFLIVVVRLALVRSQGVDRAGRVATLLFLLLSAMTDLSVLSKGPSQMWYVFWLPMILASRKGRDDLRGNR